MRRSAGCSRPTPLGALVRGVAVAAVGTVAMDLVWFYRYKRGGGERGFLEWEFSVGLDDWDKASTPGKLGKRVFEAVFQQQLEPRWAALTNNLMHWSYGLAWGALYGLVAGLAARPRIIWGVPYALAVWSTSYVVLPAAGLYKPIWEYDLPTLWQDLSAHLVYGLTSAAVFRRIF